ncbi:MAG: double-strand break repair helicase AddA [Pseudoruegeria sp.]
MIRRDDATERQVQAASPMASTWLSANAGSGKTRVLTDRVARLLLTGVEPQHILCLTYTKAAASEMQNRLFKRLGSWVMKEDGPLREELIDLGEESAVDTEQLRRARRLFARAIETPGGLKIQTIHSFCASLLRRFPLEAGVSPQFTEMDDRAAIALRDQITEEMADRLAPEIIDLLARYHTGEDFAAVTAEVVRHQSNFKVPVDKPRLRNLFDLNAGYDETSLIGDVFCGTETSMIRDLIPFLEQGSATDQKAAPKLRAYLPKAGTLSGLAQLEGIFLTGEKTKSPFSAKIGSFPTKATQAKISNILPELNAFMERVEDARPKRSALLSYQKTLAMHQFAEVFLPEYAKRKQARGWLDFDDLITKAQDLLTDPTVAQWVLFRLDGGIDHILVDEAQDTSPTQWRVIESLAQEFTSGAGARSEVDRTIFVVGDKKQSIYSFQGADPSAFDKMREHFRDRLSQVERGLQALELQYSFRSSAAVLTLVDAVFEGEEAAGLGDISRHIAFHQDLPGRVDLWPVVEKAEDPEPGAWFQPVDKPAENHHTVQLARQVAAEIKRLLDTNAPLPLTKSTSRPVRAGDFLILVQRRSQLFHEIIRACKDAKLEIAGADRLKIGGELAVKDLTALLSFLALPEDSLALAAALRSPLFGWSEQDLFTLAHGRVETHLWPRLRDNSDTYADTLYVLQDLRKQADFLRPYELLERCLTRHSGREMLLARLGEEAEDGIDALLTQALAYENSEVPSLTGFLSWLKSEDVEIKRQVDSASDKIRVMTVHGSKGLEAPIVILPDTGPRRLPSRNEVFLAEDQTPLWKMSGIGQPEVLSDAQQYERDIQTAERSRLLYVALTRAEKWLIVCAGGDLAKNGDSWYQQIEGGLQRAGAIDAELPGGTGLRFETGDWDCLSTNSTDQSHNSDIILPTWAYEAATPPKSMLKTLSPSDLGGAKALSGKIENWDEDKALQRGTQVHLLLEHLPQYEESNWNSAAKQIFLNEDLPIDDLDDLLQEAKSVLNAPHLSHVFSDTALAEVDLTATISELADRRIHGTVDRLIIAKDSVLVVDFKTNQLVPKQESEVPEGLLRQMGAYTEALSQIYPDRQIVPAILWTANASLMPLSHEVVREALLQTATS